ncbi:hypothetical protein [Chondromyces apiculatus]|uniref:Lipoprotein n=1 Tax=Chondromyces apiculatus DSM 436 TaxID=1192034 RepID=A0A017TGI3_9BACT|nr:hypothetical protein [Chondromyces apiculatus]EYF08012.1 Hypothetical protein CAP_7034 [Chondromyces apiculatus DSM 436]
MIPAPSLAPWRIVAGAMTSTVALGALSLTACGETVTPAAETCAPLEAAVVVGDCPRTRLLDAACACGEERFEPAMGEAWACAGNTLVNKVALPGVAEICNGLDEDGDGDASDSAVCATRCSPEAVNAAAASLRLPTGQDQTTVDGAPQVIGLLTNVPAWCMDPQSTPAPTDGVRVQCGEVVDVEGAQLSTESLRVAPGGVLRLSSDVTLDAGEILVCPGGVVQGTGGSVSMQANTWLHYGELHTRGGALSVRADRLLLAGEVTTGGRAGAPGKGAEEIDAEPAGDAYVEAVTESFLSGVLSTSAGDGGAQLACGPGGAGGAAGGIHLVVPVCCHDVALASGGGSGGTGGVGEDGNEGRVPELSRETPLSGSLCDASDSFRVNLDCEAWVWVEFEPVPGRDIDLLVTEGDAGQGSLVAASLGVTGREEVLVPPGDYTLTVRSFDAHGSSRGAGAYTVGVD